MSSNEKTMLTYYKKLKNELNMRQKLDVPNIRNFTIDITKSKLIYEKIVQINEELEYKFLEIDFMNIIKFPYEFKFCVRYVHYFDTFIKMYCKTEKNILNLEELFKFSLSEYLVDDKLEVNYVESMKDNVHFNS